MTTPLHSKSASPLGPLRGSRYYSRLPSLTHAEFSTHLLKNHAPIIVPWALKHKVITYTHTHLDPEIQANFTNTSKMPLLQYDGLAQMTLGGSVEEFAMAFAHPYYKEVIAKDEKRFLSDDSGEAAVTEIKDGKDKGWETGATISVGAAVDIILDGEAKIEVPDAVWEEWRKWDATTR